MNCFRAFCVVVLLLPSMAFADDDPLANIKELFTTHRFKEAREQLVKARDHFAAASNAPGEAAALLLLGAADSSLDDPVTARPELEDAAAKFTAMNDFFTAWLSLAALAKLEELQGRNDAAVAVHERIQALLSQAADPKFQVSVPTLRILGPVFGFPVEMLGPLVQIPQLAKALMLSMAEMLSRDSYAGTLLEMGALEKAEEQLTKATAAGAMLGGVFDAPIAVHTGDLRQKQWRLEEARASYLKALGGSDAIAAISFGDPAAELSILGKLAELDVLTGRVDDALAWNDKALTIVRGLKNPKREADVLEERAELLQKAARYPAAIALYDDVLKQAVANGDLFRQASIHSDLGALHLFQGTYGTSASHLDKAIDLYHRLQQPYIEAPTWILLAEVHAQLDMYDAAAIDLGHARELAKKSDFKLAGAMAEMLTTTNEFMAGKTSLTNLDDAFQTWLHLPEARGQILVEDTLRLLREALRIGSGLAPSTQSETSALPGPAVTHALPMFIRGKTQFDRGDFDGARSTWMQALELNPNNDIRAGLLGMIGASYWQEGRREEAIRYLTQVANTLEASIEDVKVEEMLAGYLGGSRHWYYHLLIDMLLQEGCEEEAFAQAERARARAFLQTVGNHRFNAEHGADPQLVREAEVLRTEIAARERRAKQAEGDEAKRLAADVERARQLYKTVLTRVKVSNPEYETLTNVAPLRLDEVRQQLPSDTTLISYFVTPREVHAWVVDRQEAHYTRLPVDQAALQRIVCWAQSFGPRLDARGVKVLAACGDSSNADDAFDQLIAPLLAAMHHAKLVIVPHGALHYVPFAALHNRTNDHFLIDDFTLTYAPSASALQFLRAKESPVDGGALVIGDPRTDLARLPGAAQEAASVARILGTSPHLGADGREALLYDLHGKCDLVHLAAHGIYDPVNPLFSKIALAAGGDTDGNLTVDEILSSLDLTGVNLVVLSACQSAAGARSSGDEVVGLTRALLYAGTPGVISTLWNIDDAASAGLMEEFYRRLTAGTSVADALRQAQLTVKESARYSDPKYWAAFVLTGDPQGRWKARQ